MRGAAPAILAMIMACGGGDDDDVQAGPDAGLIAPWDLLVVNGTSEKLRRLEFAPPGGDYGLNVLGLDGLDPGASILVEDVNGCDGYVDVIMADHAGNECELLGVDLCFDDRTWNVTGGICD